MWHWKNVSYRFAKHGVGVRMTDAWHGFTRSFCKAFLFFFSDRPCLPAPPSPLSSSTASKQGMSGTRSIPPVLVAWMRILVHERQDAVTDIVEFRLHIRGVLPRVRGLLLLDLHRPLPLHTDDDVPGYACLRCSSTADVGPRLRLRFL